MFPGNSNLIYTIIRKRQIFHSLANLPSDLTTINKSLSRRGKHRDFMAQTTTDSRTTNQKMMEGSHPAMPAQPGTKTTTLPAMPSINLISLLMLEFKFIYKNIIKDII